MGTIKNFLFDDSPERAKAVRICEMKLSEALEETESIPFNEKDWIMFCIRCIKILSNNDIYIFVLYNKEINEREKIFRSKRGAELCKKENQIIKVENIV